MSNLNVELFKNIIGYDDVKKELRNVLNWINNKEEILNENKEVVFPKGFIFYGPFGCGKTLFLNEFAESLGREIFEIKGVKKDEDEIMEAFEKARKVDKACIIIDELDLYLNGNSTKIRQLITQMDGVDKSGDIVVLATTNNLLEIPEALKRPGRFDRKILIDFPDEKNAKKLLEVFLKRLINDEKVIQNIDLDFLSRIFAHKSCIKIKMIINDCYLRYNKEITTEHLESSSYFVQNDQLFEYDKESSPNNKYVACHEAAHALMIDYYDKFFKFYHATIQELPHSRGMANLYDNDDQTNLEKEIARIDIGIAGYLGLKLVYNYVDKGACEDLLNARFAVRRLINTFGYKGIKYVLRSYDPNARNECDEFVKKNDIISRRLFKQRIRFVKNYLKKNKTRLIALSDVLYEKGIIKKEDIDNVKRSC